MADTNADSRTPHRAYVLTKFDTKHGCDKIIAVVTDQSRAVDWATGEVQGANFVMADLNPAVIIGLDTPQEEG